MGPGGISKEIDILILRPDYPAALRDEATILASGVLAAFESKLTFKLKHMEEVLQSKKQLMEVAGTEPTTIEEALRGSFPLLLLAHSCEDSAAFKNGIQEAITDKHLELSQSIQDPRHETDGLLIADKAFFSTSRAALTPRIQNGAVVDSLPMSSFMVHSNGKNLPGTPILRFLMWLQKRASEKTSPLDSLTEAFGDSSQNGYMRYWPIDIYPEYLQSPSFLMNPYGGSVLVD